MGGALGWHYDVAGRAVRREQDPSIVPALGMQQKPQVFSAHGCGVVTTGERGVQYLGNPIIEAVGADD